MALRANDFAGYRTVILEVFKNEGAQGLWKGLGPNVVGIFIYKGVSFLYYENLKVWIEQANWLGKSHFIEFVAAGIASITAQSMTYPFDVIKRRYMVQRERKHKLCN